jgi:hypothetical protein
LQKILKIIIVINLVLSGCSVSRRSADHSLNAEKSTITTGTIRKVISNNITNESFNIQKADIKVIQDNMSVRLTASLKFRKPDSLLITIRSKAGIEAGRALITKDTVLINDRVNKTLLIGKPDVIGPKYGIEPMLIYAVLGDVIVDEKDKDRSINCNNGIFSDDFEINKKKVEYTIDCGKGKTVKSYFEGDITSGNITIRYADISNINRIKYPKNIEINDDLKSMNILIEIKKIEIPWNGKIGFVSGLHYKVIKIR